MENKKRYAVGCYNHQKRMEEEGWWNSAQNRLVTYIYDNEDLFDIRYKTTDQEGNRTWYIIDPKELNKAKEYFTISEDVADTLEWIDTCNDYDKWKSSCNCCDSISINTIPYTYREYGGWTGREYNCAFCGSLTNRMAGAVGEEYRSNGLENAINLLISMNNGEYIDEEEKYYCTSCECDLRRVGLVENNETILVNNYKNDFYRFTIDEYNKREEENEKEIEGYYPHYFEDKSKYEDTDGYRCFLCNAKADKEVVDEFLSLEKK